MTNAANQLMTRKGIVLAHFGAFIENWRMVMPTREHTPMMMSVTRRIVPCIVKPAMAKEGPVIARKIVEGSARRYGRRCDGVQFTRCSSALVINMAPTPKRKQSIQPTWDQVRHRTKRMGEHAKRTKKAMRWSQPRSIGRAVGVTASVGIAVPLTPQP